MKPWCGKLAEFNLVAEGSMAEWELARLTPREREIVQRIALGQTNPEVSRLLHITPGTLRNHLSAVYAKLGVRSRSEAASWAWRSGLVGP